MIKGLLFDMDCVVIDSEPFNDDACAELLKNFGKNYDREILKPQMVGKSDIEGMNILVQHYQIPISGEEFNIRRKKNKRRFYKEEIPFMNGFEDFFHKIVKQSMLVPTTGESLLGSTPVACSKTLWESFRGTCLYVI
jgi:beta-phosphoglucomutase-like phosphatase (HAD superfamily)